MTASDTLAVLDRGQPISFSFAAMMDYHGPGSPGGVAHAFKVLQRGLPLLDSGAPPERREIAIRTPFGGPGARDGFELVTRAVTDDRYVVDPALARPERGRTAARFVFELGYRGATTTLLLREGFVVEEFIDLLRIDDRDEQQAARLDVLKAEMAERLTASPADEVYEVAEPA